MIITADRGRSFWPARAMEVGANDPMAALARKIDNMPTDERQAMIAQLSGPMPGRRDLASILARAAAPQMSGVPQPFSAYPMTGGEAPEGPMGRPLMGGEMPGF